MLSYATQKFREQRIINDSKINKIELESKHFRNLKAIASREDLLELLPKNSIRAEIGVNKGEYSKKNISN